MSSRRTASAMESPVLMPRCERHLDAGAGSRRHHGVLAVHRLDAAREYVLAAEEFSDVTVGGAVVDVAGRTCLTDFAPVHHDHEVRERDRLELRVGHVHERDAEFALHVAQFLAHLKPRNSSSADSGSSSSNTRGS